MGLDIYAQWDNMTQAEHDAQITGFSDAPEAGYVRHNWSSVRFMGRHTPNPITMVFPGWQGDNGDGFSVDQNALVRLISVQNDLQAYLDSETQSIAEKPATEMSDEDYWFRKLRVWIEFLHFVIQHANKPGLRIIYG